MEDKSKDKDIHPFNEISDCTDLVLRVEDTQVHVNKNVLMIASPVFKAMLSSDFKEKKMCEIPLPGKKVADVVAFLRCIYPSILENIRGDNVFEVLPLADEYQCETLKEKCEVYLRWTLSQCSNVEFLIKCVIVAEKHSLGSLLKESIDVISTKELAAVNHRLDELSTKNQSMITKKRVEKLEKFCSTVEKLVLTDTEPYQRIQGYGPIKIKPIDYETYKSKLQTLIREEKPKVFET